MNPVTAFKQLLLRNTLHCDDDSNSLIDAADKVLENSKPVLKTPIQYDGLKYVFQSGLVGTFDGLRVQIGKQINLQAVSQTFFQIGSSTQGHVHQYRLILPITDDFVFDASQDLDFNTNFELRTTNILKGINAKGNYSLQSDQSGKAFNSLGGSLEYTDKVSAAELTYNAQLSDPWAGSIGYAAHALIHRVINQVTNQPYHFAG